MTNTMMLLTSVNFLTIFTGKLKAMKNLVLLIIVITAFAGCSGPQQTANINDASAPINASIIEVQTGLGPKAAYKKLARILQDNGYALKNTDATLLSVTTEPKDFGRWNSQMTISADVRESSTAKIVIRGSFTFMDSQTQITKTGQNGSVSRVAWSEMHKLAEKMGGELSYR
jgi:uncharacterized lipoprotein